MTQSGTEAERRFRRASEIFERARQLPPADREASAKESCAGDAALFVEVQALLAYHELGGDRLDRGMFKETRVGAIIGRYRIEDLLGEGGMGSVFRATQLEPVKREVALKLIKIGMDTRQVIRRFEAERQTLARLEHPNIARVLDGGVTSDGRPYFAMDLVRGVPITDHCDSERLDWRARVELFIHVCTAVQHAHQRGILHRDLKPSNLLVTRVDGVASPKVIDFGVAKALGESEDEATLNTVAGHAVGTPDYMSPEQANGADVDTRTDVYALGVVLYQLLVGTTPLKARGAARALLGDEPVKPSSAIDAPSAARRATDIAGLRKAVRGDLDSIVLKALAREPARRYSTVAALSDDLKRLLRHEPVSARPPSLAYLTSKFARRHTFALVAASLAVASLLVGFGVSIYGLHTARVERDAARHAGDEQKRLADKLAAQLFVSNVERGRQSVRTGSWLEASDLLWGALSADPNSAQARWALREMVWAQGCVGTVYTSSAIESVRFLPGGERLFLCGVEGRPLIHDLGTGTSVELDGPSLGAWEVDVNRDGTIGCTANLQGGVTIWDLRQRAQPHTVVQCGNGRSCVQCSRDDGNVAFAGGKEGVLWRIALDGSEEPRQLATGSSIKRIVIAPDGAVAAGCEDGSVLLIGPDGTNERRLLPQSRGIQSIAFGHDGRLMATGTTGTSIEITDVATGENVQSVSTRVGTVRDLRFGPDDRTLLVLGWWQLSEIDRETENARQVICVPAWRFDATPDGRTIAMAGSGTKTVSVWRLGADAVSLRGWTPPHTAARPIAGSSDEDGLAFLASAEDAALGLNQRGRVLWRVPSLKPRAMAGTRDGSMFGMITADHRARVYRTSDQSLVAEADGARVGDANSIAFHENKLFAFVTVEGSVRGIDLETGAQRELAAPASKEVFALGISRDGSMLSVCERNLVQRLVDLRTGAERRETSFSSGFSTAISTDGNTWLIGTWRGDLLARDLRTGATHTLRGHTARIMGIVTHPTDQDIVLTHSNDGSVRVWHLGLNREVLVVTPFGHGSSVRAAAFLGTGECIAVAGTGGELATYSIELADRYIDRTLPAERARLGGVAPGEEDMR